MTNQENIQKKRIGVLTSGGDAPGMNAGVRAVVLTAIKLGYEVMGIYGGYKGLIDNYCNMYRGEPDENGKYTNPVEPEGLHLISEGDLEVYGADMGMKLLYERDVDDIVDKSGTILYSDRCNKFNTKEGMAMAKEVCQRCNIVGLITIGGDGTLSGATELSMDFGVNCIGFPGSIDNDLVVSDYTVGFDTAMNTVIDMADNARYTCCSHTRGEVIEVMGRGAGDIALNTGIASGANAIILKENGFDKEKTTEKVIAHLESLRKAGKRDFIVILAEGVPLDLDTGYGKSYGEALTNAINNYTGDDTNAAIEAERANDPDNLSKHRRPDFIETKFVRLAHLVRGGVPTLRDRLTATRMGQMAVRLLDAGEDRMVVVEQDGQLVALDINYALSADKMYKIKMNKDYFENGALSADGLKDYNKYIKKFEKFSAMLTKEQINEMDSYTDRKLKEFRQLCDDAAALNG